MKEIIATLDKDDLISLVKGSCPFYDVFNHPLVKKCGEYVGGFHDKWVWNSNLGNLSEEELWYLYILCKNSWKTNNKNETK